MVSEGIILRLVCIPFIPSCLIAIHALDLFVFLLLAHSQLAINKTVPRKSRIPRASNLLLELVMTSATDGHGHKLSLTSKLSWDMSLVCQLTRTKCWCGSEKEDKCWRSNPYMSVGVVTLGWGKYFNPLSDVKLWNESLYSRKYSETWYFLGCIEHV